MGNQFFLPSQLASQVAICVIFVNIDLQTTPFLLGIFVYILVRVRPLVIFSQLYQFFNFIIMHRSMHSLVFLPTYLFCFYQVATCSQLSSQLASYILSLLPDLRVNANKKGQVERNVKTKKIKYKQVYITLYLSCFQITLKGCKEFLSIYLFVILCISNVPMYILQLVYLHIHIFFLHNQLYVY